MECLDWQVNHGARIREETASWVKKSTGLFWKAGKNTNMLVLRAPINFLPGDQVCQLSFLYLLSLIAPYIVPRQAFLNSI